MLFQLQDETARKVSVLLSEDMELRRQLEYLNWTDAFVPVLEVCPVTSLVGVFSGAYCSISSCLDCSMCTW